MKELKENKVIKKKVAIYIRVSTDMQAEEGYSLDFQKEKLIMYCELHDLGEYEIYEDGGWSGSNIERPGIQRLIKDVEQGKISYVLVYKLDRLSRSQRDTMFIIEDVINKYNVSFVSLMENLNTSTPTGKAMIGLLSVFAQLERENILLRTREGMLARVKSGKWPCSAITPYGYTYVPEKDMLVIDPERAAKVRQAFILYIRGYTANRIYNLLGFSNEKMVVRLLGRKVYLGLIEYKGETYQGSHKPLITQSLFDKAQAELARRNNNTIKSTGTHLLASMVYCGNCGAKMCYRKWGKQGIKLVCYSQQSQKKYMIKDKDCTQLKVSSAEVEKIVLNTIFNMKINKVDVSDGNNNELKEEISLLDNIEKSMKDLEKEIANLYNVYAKSPDEMLLHIIEEKKQKYIETASEYKRAKEGIDNTSLKDELTDRIDNIKEAWDFMTIEEQQTIIRCLVNKVVITGNKVRVVLNI